LPCAANIAKIEFCRHKQNSEVAEEKNDIIINSYLRVVDIKKICTKRLECSNSSLIAVTQRFPKWVPWNPRVP